MEIFLTFLTILGGVVFALLVLMLLVVIFLFTVCKFSLWHADWQRKKQLKNLHPKKKDDSLFR